MPYGRLFQRAFGGRGMAGRLPL